jgi:hypothetical protein
MKATLGFERLAREEDVEAEPGAAPDMGVEVA